MKERSRQSKASLRAFLWTLLVVAGITLFMIKSFTITIIMGSLLAMLSYPLHKLLLRRKVRPSIAAIFVTILVISLALAPLVTFAGIAVKQAVIVGQTLAESEAISFEDFVSTVKAWPLLGNLVENVDLEGKLKDAVQTIGKAASKWIVTFAKNLPEGVMKFFLAGMTCFFLLRDGSQFLEWIYARLPFTKDIRQQLMDVFKNTAISAIWATMAAAGVQALIMTVSFLLLKVPAAFFAGGLTFIFAFVPLVGSVPVWFSGGIYLFMSGHPAKAGVMLGIGVFTATIDNFVRPWILKGRNEMHPLVALLAIIGGIETFGVPGVFLGPILAALLITLLQIWPLIGERSNLNF